MQERALRHSVLARITQPGSDGTAHGGRAPAGAAPAGCAGAPILVISAVGPEGWVSYCIAIIRRDADHREDRKRQAWNRQPPMVGRRCGRAKPWAYVHIDRRDTAWEALAVVYPSRRH